MEEPLRTPLEAEQRWDFFTGICNATHVNTQQCRHEKNTINPSADIKKMALLVNDTTVSAYN